MIPALSYLIQTKVREHQISIFQKKFNKGLEMMILNGKMGPYYSDTHDFVKELSNHLKLTQICRVGDSPSSLPPITSCFGDNYDKITINSNGDTVDITSIASGASLGITTLDSTNNWSSDNIAVLTIDGNRMILSYNTKCPEIEAGVYATTEAEGCVAGVADVDGVKKPNTLHKDVYLFGNARSLSDPCVIGKQIGLCYSSPISTSYNKYLTYQECLDQKDSLGLTTSMCSDSDGLNNYYAYAVKLCGNINKLLTAEDAIKMVNYAYGTNLSSSDVNQTIQDGSYVQVATISNFDDTIASRLVDLGLGSLDIINWRTLITNAADSNGYHREIKIRKNRIDIYSSRNWAGTISDAGGRVFCKAR